MPRPQDLTARLRRIRLVVCDVDGVLTDGAILVGPDGGETKIFSVLDGTGFVLGALEGLQAAFLSGRRSAAVTQRARECHIALVAQGIPSGGKADAFARLCRRAGVPERSAAYIGDDLIDLPVFSRAGLAVAVANAVPEVRRAAHWVTRTPGGHGAVREVTERLLRAQGRWQSAVNRYLKPYVAKT
jgi:3-deoxy-D-manno-octulosonate 8-phosphate phosphatase (KDO 8-P phosphatase)